MRKEGTEGKSSGGHYRSYGPGAVGIGWKADYFFQVGKIELRGRALALKEQTQLDKLLAGTVGNGEKGRLFGQVKLGEW